MTIAIVVRRTMLALLLAVCVCGQAVAQTILCHGTACGGPGPLKYMYKVENNGLMPITHVIIATSDAGPQMAGLSRADHDGVYVVTDSTRGASNASISQGDYGDYTFITMPPGWQFDVVVGAAEDIHTPSTAHGQQTWPNALSASYVVFYNVSGNPIDAGQSYYFGFDHPWIPHDVSWQLGLADEATVDGKWADTVGDAFGPVHGPWQLNSPKKTPEIIVENKNTKIIPLIPPLSVSSCDGPYVVAQAGTTWIGAVPPYGSTVGAPGVWDFDDGGTRACYSWGMFLGEGAYAQGWTSRDLLENRGIYWTVQNFLGTEFSCSSNPINGNYSAWCGIESGDTDNTLFSAPGYGSNWRQWMYVTEELSTNAPSLSFSYATDVEPGYDYCYVIIDQVYTTQCGEVSAQADTLRCYTGVNSGSESIDLSNLAADPSICDLSTTNDYTNLKVNISFVVVSDGNWDDGDGKYDTCDGAFTIDDIAINSLYGLHTTDFESGDLGFWNKCVSPSPGDFAAIRNLSSFVNNDVCGFEDCGMSGCVLSFFDGGILGEYGNGGHYAGSFQQIAWSPTVDLTSYPPRGYTLAYDCYADLPIENWIFYRHYVSYVQCATCPTGFWSPPQTDNYVYYMPVPSCYEGTWGFSQFVPADADSVMIGLSVWNGCEVWNVPCTSGNESPIFDNVRLGIWDLSIPQASIRDVDNYTDSWPEDATYSTNASGLIDAANNLSQEGEFLRLADSLVIALDAPNACAELCFRIRPGPGANLTDPWWSRMGFSPTACETTATACVRMDTAFAAGDGIPRSPFEFQIVTEGYYASMIHESDPRYLSEGEEIFPDSLFTPGTQIYYGIRSAYLPGPGPYSWLPTGADMNDVSTLYEVEVLPNDCESTCLLYVDYYNRGAQAPIEAALASLGRTWDRFDLRGESSHQGNGLGNRILGANGYALQRGPIGPSNSHLGRYKVMLINTGDLDVGSVFSDGGTGMPVDPTNDIAFLDEWINEGGYKGLWLSGNNIAEDFDAATSGPKQAFLSNTLGAGLVSPSYRELVGHPATGESCRLLRPNFGAAASDNYYDTFNAVALIGSGCPQSYNFDVLGKSGAGTGLRGTALIYDRTDQINPPDGYGASVDHIFLAGGSGDTVRTKIDGFSLHLLRYQDCVDYTGMRLWMRDVLGGYDYNEYPGYFYDRYLGRQYCRPAQEEGPVPVDLAEFSATPLENGILLEWSSTAVSDVSAFSVHRAADGPRGDFIMIADVPATNEGGRTRHYSYMDNAVVTGTLYYYKLEALEPGGSVFFGPVGAVAGQQAARYWLGQNMPNPFSRETGTTIHYSVAKPGVVEIMIFDVAGRRVTTIKDQAELGGNFVVWDCRTGDGRDVASGVYFYQIKAGDFANHKKMLLVR